MGQIRHLGAVQVEVAPVALRSKSSYEAGVEVTIGQRKNRRLKMPLTWIDVFDGHGGEKASQFCADWLSSYVRNEESYPIDLGYSMKTAFTAIDEDFIATGHPVFVYDPEYRRAWDGITKRALQDMHAHHLTSNEESCLQVDDKRYKNTQIIEPTKQTMILLS
jgi:hypothetical protein